MPVDAAVFQQLPHELINKGLIEAVPKAIAAMFPIKTEKGDVELRADNVRVDAEKVQDGGWHAWQKARQTGKSIAAPLLADVSLYRDGKKVQSRAGFKLGELPLQSALGTFMVKGNDWFTPAAQFRLKPGAYVRQKRNGEYEGFMPMKGASMTVWMDPAKGVFKLSHGSTNVGLYPILKALGASDETVIEALGGDARAKELVEANKTKSYTKDVDKLFESVFRLKQNRDLLKAGVLPADPETQVDEAVKITALKQWMDTKTVDPYVTEKTLGAPIAKAGIPLFMATAKKILDVQRGDKDSDERDSPHFKTSHDIVDMMTERAGKLTKMLSRKVLQKLGRAKDATLSEALGTGFLNPVTMGYFGGSLGIPGGMASTAEAANPLALLSEQTKSTFLGPGGIQDLHAVSKEARLARPGQLGFVDLVHSPEGAAIGLTTHLAVGARKVNNTLAARFVPIKSGKAKWDDLVGLTIEEANDTVVGYPEYWDRKTGTAIDPYTGDKNPKFVRANVDGEVREVPPSEVKYVLPNGGAAFDHTSNAALLFAHTHPNRGMMAGKHLTQALPLVDREAPLIKLKTPGGADVLDQLGKMSTIRATVGGKVTKVEDNAIYVDGVKHELFDKYPMQAKVSIDHNPVVKVGDTVKKGDLLADSNYTKDGALALGVNLRTAYMPWKNAGNYEDAIVISETAAHKLRSEHAHRVELETDEDTTVGAKQYMAQFPALLTKENLSKLGEDGVIKEGQELVPGDLVIAAVRKRKYDTYDKSTKNLSSIHKSLERPYVDAGVKWEEDYPAKVYRVVRTPTKIEVHIRTEEPMRVADKLSMSSAAKGTVAMILPDDKMPRDSKDRPMEVIFNPHGVAGRINPSQTLEQAAGKLVRDHGVDISHAHFDGVDNAKLINDLMKKHGVTHEEKLFDPEEGAFIENPVATGYNYVFKLDHPVRKKFSARGRDGYTMDEAPTRGAGKGGQSFDQLTSYALLGHNAHAILGESFGARGAKNDEFWRAYQAGEQPPPPKVPFIFEKFRGLLAGAGVDTEQHGDALHFIPLTDDNILKRSHGEIQKPTLIKSKDLAIEKGGLFDEKITGGMAGDRYAHIDLGRKIPHPLYEKVINDVLGLKRADFYGLIGQTRHYDPGTESFTDTPGQNTLTGEAAFKKLMSFDVDERLKEVQEKARTAVGSDLNRYNRSASYLKGLKKLKLDPFEAYMTSKIAVIPPKFRPIIEQRDGGLRVADSNLLYRDVLLTKQTLDHAEKDGTLSSDDLAKARVSIYDSVGALVGVGKSLTHRRDTELRGFVDIIKGAVNKEGLFQQQLARRRNDYTGRSTIEPDATLGPDEIAIPEDMAWKIYQPALVRRLAQAGWKPAEALKQVEGRTLVARNVLDAELKTRPVIYNRAPSLHRWNASAAIPKLTAGKEIKMSPLAFGPQNADSDGDTVSVYVPLTDKAQREAHELLPTRNLFYDRDRSLAYGIDKDVVTGLFALTRTGSNSGKSYDTRADAIEAYKANKDGLRMDSLVRIKDEASQGLQAIGWLIFEGLVPARYLAQISAPITGKKLETILTRIARESPADYNALSRSIQQAGFYYGARAGGITATVQELALDRGKIMTLLNQMETSIRRGKTMDEKRDLANAAFKEHKGALDQLMTDHLHDIGLGGSVFLHAKPSSKLGIDSYRQMLVSPILVKDTNDKTIPSVIKSSYGTGMLLSDYMLSTPGARAGMIDKGLSVAAPGALAKEMAGNLGPVRIEIHDCETQKGIEMPLESTDKSYDADLLDRHLLRDIPGVARRNDVVTPQMLSKLRDKRETHIWVRSPMTCEADKPPCQMCAGRSASGEMHPIGANIGYNYGQSISERSTQTLLKAFHSGGTVGAGVSSADGFARLRELLSAPETVKGQGTLSDTAGTVTSIKAAPQGGHYIHIEPNKGETPVEHYVLPGRNVAVVKNEKVQLGDRLSDGVYRPQEIAAKKGLLAAQQYVVDEMRKAYQASGTVVRRPVLEVAAAAIMRFMRITNDGNDHTLTVGQVIPEAEFKRLQEKNPKIQGVPELPGISQVPLVRSKDLLERLNFQRLEQSIAEIPAMGGTSDITGKDSPISGFAYGAKFRPGEAAHELSDKMTHGDSAWNRLQHLDS